MYQFIQTQSQLTQVLDHMVQHKKYAADTEFLKVDTLWPKLGLFQINIQEQIYLLDGTTLDLTPFWALLTQAKENIFHACGEDLDLIYFYSKTSPLSNVFDTQVALSFLGHGLQVSYQNALKEHLGVEIEKDQTRSDWTARPLSSEQLCYAANDVIFLPKLADVLKVQLKEKKLLEYVVEDCVSLAYEIAHKTVTSKLYQDVGNYRHSSYQLMQLQQLMVWREQLVKAVNIPRSFVLKNNAMIDLVEKNPKSIFQLSEIKSIRASVIREHGKTILDLLRFLPEKELWPNNLPRPVKYISEDVAVKIEQLVNQVADELQIPKMVLMRKKWFNELYVHVVSGSVDKETLSPYLRGWRYNVLIQPLLLLLEQDKANLVQQICVKRPF
ncbi:ribonuclease D [Acinetobacter rathckeae]|uniref:ribonuclease D n=1 Tax=Acinetobacter rathckeae TaxID=2605272 RepID=UPI0018A2DAA4|nr:HRDC domain-containing protein [Acinetobacter rathckeae]MBF7686993.1 HRDC domain-containing protein [Acinetobacter rathckeae]MBF7694603.1 HRDC domain-containing protein [Acinetobacter rathckeae]